MRDRLINGFHRLQAVQPQKSNSEDDGVGRSESNGQATFEAVRAHPVSVPSRPLDMKPLRARYNQSHSFTLEELMPAHCDDQMIVVMQRCQRASDGCYS